MSSLNYRIFTLLIALSLAISILILGCGNKETAKGGKTYNNDKLLARIKDDVITVSDFEEELAFLPDEYKGIAMLNKRQFLESLINRRVLLQEAKKRDLENAENVKRLFQKAREEIIIQELIDREVINKGKVSESEIEKYYLENKERYFEPAKIRASHILVDSEVMAEKILADLRNGADFGELAKEYSLDIPTKEIGGDIGYFSRGTFFPEFEEVCEKLNVSEISDVIKTDLGYHIIQVADKKETTSKPLEEVNDAIEDELLLNKQITLYDSLIKELKTNREITIDSDLLETIDYDFQKDTKHFPVSNPRDYR